MHVDLNAMVAAIRPDMRVVYLCNSNNPLPTIIEKKALEDRMVTISQDRMVFIDKAHYQHVNNPDFSSMLHLLAEGLNKVVVARTASKIHGSVDILAQHAALVSYQDQ